MSGNPATGWVKAVVCWGGAIVAAAALGAGASGWRQAVPEGGGGFFAGSEDGVIDVGTLVLGQTHVMSVEVRNDGSASAAFKVVSSCNCTSVVPADFTLRAGERRQLKIELNTWELRSASGDGGPFSVDIRLLADGGMLGADRVRIHGRVKDMLGVREEDLFIEQFSSDDLVDSISIPLHAVAGIEGLRVASVSPDAFDRVNIRWRNGLPVSLDLLPRERLPLGWHQYEIDLLLSSSTLKDEGLRYNVTLHMRHPFRLSPSKIYLADAQGHGNDVYISVHGVHGYDAKVVATSGYSGAKIMSDGRSVFVPRLTSASVPEALVLTLKVRAEGANNEGYTVRQRVPIALIEESEGHANWP